MTIRDMLSDWQKALYDKIGKVEPLKLGKSYSSYWVQPEHYIMLTEAENFQRMRKWCKDSLGYCHTNEPKFRFYFKTEADRTAFMMVWCFEKTRTD